MAIPVFFIRFGARFIRFGIAWIRDANFEIWIRYLLNRPVSQSGRVL
jgi:hypothetical protein